MNRLLRTTVTALAALAVTAPLALAQNQAPEVKALAIGSAAPEASTPMKGVDGREVSIESLKGKHGTLVIFSCNACPWAKAWETRIVELGNTYQKKGVGVVMINPNDPAVAAEDGYEVMVTRAKQRRMAFPYVVDATSDVARAFGATRTPEVFLFDRGGKLVYHGAVDDNGREPGKVTARYLKDALDAVVANKPVPVAETKALGCTIKFRKPQSSAS